MSEQPGFESNKMVACEVTNQMVPEDETVVIQGKRVSARGKQILLDQLSTGHNIDGELEAPGSWRRLGCAILDGLIVALFGAGFGAVLGLVFLSGGGTQDGRVEGGIETVATLIGMMYFALMHASSGQTVGKKVGKYKVINLDGSSIDFKTALIRAFMFNGMGMISGAVLLVGGYDLLTVYTVVAGVIGIYGLANAITVLASKDKRAIHDMLAGTRVVMLED